MWVPYGELANKHTLKNTLTVRPKFDNREPIPTYIEGEEYFGIPRNYSAPPTNTEDRRITNAPINIEFKGELRPIQENMVQDWLSLYNQGVSDFIIKGDTGVGKTIIMLKMATIMNVPFLVVVPLERLMSYWVDQIKQFTTVEDVGWIQQNKCDFNKKACVGMLHSIAKDKYSDEFKNHFGLIIYDEIHSTSTEHFSPVVSMFPAKYRVGASATLERQDQTEKVYYYHLGRNIITSEKKTQPKPNVFRYRYNITSGSIPKWVDRYDPIKVRACVLSLLSKNEKRNDLIAQFAMTLMDKGLQTLVIGDRIAQLEAIQAALKGYGYTNTGLYIGKTPDEEKRRIEKESDCILATLRMLEIGIDIDTLRGLVFATPKSEVKQVVGRIRRINPSVPKPVVVDIIDEKYPEAKRWAAKRNAFYEEEKFKVQHIKGA